ncbi:MAG: mechanosensitive ion channel family protein [Alphaproteobacteria bacterium]
MQESLTGITDWITANGPAILINMVAALVLLALGVIVARVLRRAVLTLLAPITLMDKTYKPLIASLVQYTMVLVVLVAVLSQMGVDTTSIIAVLGAAGLAIGLALQGTLSNIAAGTLILWLRPYKVGEYVDAEGLAGTVEEVGLFHTTLTGPDGLYTTVPNTEIWNRPIRNFTRNAARRVELLFTLQYQDDAVIALEIAKGIIHGDARILVEPAPQALAIGLGELGTNLSLRFWVKGSDYLATQSEMATVIKARLQAAGFTFAVAEMNRGIPKAKSPEQA